MNDQIFTNFHITLVLVSFTLAIISFFVGFDIFNRLATQKGRQKIVWLLYGTFAVGIGIWTSHFIGMMAFMHFHTFDIPFVFSSLVLAMVLTFMSLSISTKAKTTKKRIVLASVSITVSFLLLNFFGMEAINGHLKYNRLAMTASLLLALLAPFLIIKMVVKLRSFSSISDFRVKLYSGVLFGLSLMFMHYISMLGMAIRPRFEDTLLLDNNHYLSVGLIVGSFFILSIFIVSSIIDRKLSTQSLKLSQTEQDYRSLFEHNPDIVVRFDKNGIVLSVNKALERITGYKIEEWINQHYQRIVMEEYYEKTNEQFLLATKGLATDCESVLIHNNGNKIHIYVTNIPIIINSEIVGVYCIVKDITDKKKAELTIQHLAFHDYLTGLPNRSNLEHTLSKLLNKAIDTKQTLAILFIDLDRFKLINDTHGHSLGDILLKEVAVLLKESVLQEDIVFRQGGDEFIIILENADRDVASTIALNILEALSTPIKIHHNDIFTTPSIGISLFPEDGETAETLVKNADFAMYQAKLAGKNTYHFYSTDESKNGMNPLELEMNLHKAIKQDEFMLYYQPKVNLKTGRIVGAEALIRWNHPKLGMVSPADFIPIAEETGLIIPIGEWALYTACLQNKKWHEQGFMNIVISVNLSVRQFLQINIVETIEKVLQATELEAQFLELEITESMTADIERAITTLQALKKLGVRISIDDFGTGFSSLNYLKRFPVDTLKIDQSFVSELHTNPYDETIVKTIISMAHNLNLNVVAEGIETKEQLIFLQEHLCEEGQGYFFSKPITEEEFIRQYKEIEGLVKMFGISEELHEKYLIEETLRNARVELQNTVKYQQGLIFKFVEKSGDYIHTLCDGMLLSRLNLIPSQVIGKSVFDFLPYDKAVELTKIYERAWNGEENVTFEGPINHIHTFCALNPIKRGGEVIEVIGSSVDIRKLKETEMELTETQNLYQLMAENMEDLISVFDVKGNMLYASPSHETVLGFPVSILEGRNLVEGVINKEDKEMHMQIFEDVVRTKKSNRIELTLTKSDGNLCLFDLYIKPVIDEKGKVQHVVGVAKNVY